MDIENHPHSFGPIVPREAMRPGDLLLFHRATGLSRLITWFTRSPIYHVGLYAGAGMVLEARPRGVVERDLNDVRDGSVYLAVKAPCPYGERALAWARERLGAPYDHPGVVILVLERIFRWLRLNLTPDDRYSCTELVVEAYHAAGCDLFPGRLPAGIVPGDFEAFLPEVLRSRLRPGAPQPNP